MTCGAFLLLKVITALLVGIKAKKPKVIHRTNLGYELFLQSRV